MVGCVVCKLMLLGAVKVYNAQAEAEQIILAVEAELQRWHLGGADDIDDVGYLIVADLEPIVRRLEVFKLVCDKLADAASEDVPVLRSVEGPLKIPAADVVKGYPDRFILIHCMYGLYLLPGPVWDPIGLSVAYLAWDFKCFFCNLQFAQDFPGAGSADADLVELVALR